VSRPKRVSLLGTHLLDRISAVAPPLAAVPRLRTIAAPPGPAWANSAASALSWAPPTGRAPSSPSCAGTGVAAVRGRNGERTSSGSFDCTFRRRLRTLRRARSGWMIGEGPRLDPFALKTHLGAHQGEKRRERFARAREWTLRQMRLRRARICATGGADSCAVFQLLVASRPPRAGSRSGEETSRVPLAEGARGIPRPSSPQS